MAKAIIHIGMHKTGSSSIQATLASLPPGRGPTIVRIGGTANLSGQLKKGFNSNMTPGRLRSATSETFGHKRSAAKSRIKRAIEAFEGEDIVVSAEGFTGLTGSDFDEFLQLLSGRDIHVLGYIRPPRSMMSSAFQQRLRIGLGQLNPNALMPAYKGILEKFERLPSFKLKLFDRKYLLNGDVVQDFCAEAGIQITPEEVVIKNEGLSLEAGKLLYSLNKWRENVGLTKQRGYILASTLSELGGDKLYLASEIVDPVIEANRASIDWVEKKLGMAFPCDKVAGGIRSEAEMLDVAEETTRWLAKQVRKDWIGPPSAETIGMWMQLLYERAPVLAARNGQRLEDGEDDEV